MIKLLLALITAVSLSANIKSVETKQMEFGYTIDKVCIDGYLFVVTRYRGNSIAIEQMYKPDSGFAIPVRCKNED